MKKEKVFIIVTQMKSLVPKSTTSWQVTEKVEFVSTIRNKHISTATAICDYVNKTIVLGTSKGVTDYEVFEKYIRYPKQLETLDAYFRPKVEENQPVVIEESIIENSEPNNEIN